MTAEQIEIYVRSLAREELGIEPTDRELARGCAALAATLLSNCSAGYLRLPPKIDVREPKAMPPVLP